MDILHIDFEQPKDLVFNRARLRKGFAKIGQAHAHVARRLARRIRGRSSRAGETPASQTGALARSIAYNVPRASKRRSGLMVKIAPSWKGEKRKNLWGRGGVPIQGTYYPAILNYGVKQASYGMSKKDRRHKRHHAVGGGWRISPRENYMVEALEKLKGWTQHTLSDELQKSLRPQPRKRKKK